MFVMTLVLLQIFLPLIHAHPIGSDVTVGQGLHIHEDTVNMHVLADHVVALSNPQDHTNEVVEVPSGNKEDPLGLVGFLCISFVVLGLWLTKPRVRFSRFSFFAIVQPSFPYSIPALRAPPR